MRLSRSPSPFHNESDNSNNCDDEYNNNASGTDVLLGHLDLAL